MVGGRGRGGGGGQGVGRGGGGGQGGGRGGGGGGGGGRAGEGGRGDRGRGRGGQGGRGGGEGDRAEAENPTNEPETPTGWTMKVLNRRVAEPEPEPIAAPEGAPDQPQELGAASGEEPEWGEAIVVPEEEPEGLEPTAAPEEEPDEPRERIDLGEPQRELRRFLRTRLVNCLRINRRNDPRYEGRLEEIAGDLDIYLSHPSGRNALFPPRMSQPKDYDNNNNDEGKGKGKGKGRVKSKDGGFQRKPSKTKVETRVETRVETVKVKQLSGARILSNHFPVHFSKNFQGDQEFQFHDVKFNRRMTPQEKYIAVLELFKRVGPASAALSSGGESCNFLVHGGELLSYGNLWRNDNQAAKRFGWRVQGVTATFTYKETVDKESHIRYMETNHSDVAEFPQRTIHALNMIVKELCRKREYLETKDMAFDIREELDWHDPLLYKRKGYFQSVRVLQGGLTVNVDTGTKVFYNEDKTLHDLLKDMLRSKHFNDNVELFPESLAFSDPPEWRQLEFVNKYWKGLQIQSSHKTNIPEANNGLWGAQKPEYSICEVASEVAESKIVLVPCRRYKRSSPQPEEVNLLDFMFTQYKYTDQRSLKGHLPAIKVSNEGRYLPWGCCKTTSVSRFTGKPIIPPVTVETRYGSILDWMKKRNKIDKSHVWAEDTFNVDVSTDMIEVQNSLTVDMPQIVTGADDATDSGRTTPRGRSQGSTSNAVVDISGKKYWLPARVLRWGLLSFVRADLEGKETLFLDGVRHAATSRGMTWAGDATVSVRIPPGRRRTYETRRKKVEDVLHENFNDKQLNLIVCFMEKRMNPEYPAVKVGCDRTLGVASQVIILDNNALKMNKLHMKNLALKINVKCGGVNFKLRWQLQELGSPYAGPIILLGADVTHPKSDDSNMKSIAAVVATTSSEAVNYTCRVTILPARQEIISNLKGLVLELLDNYVKTEKQHPQTIYYFRDGISEMDLVSALRYEGHAIMEAVQELAKARDPGGRQPDLVIVLAIKRHKTRFFLFKNGVDPGQVQNLEPGTVIQQTVTHPIEFDFFLCSQKALRGTSRPVRYHVLLDQVKVDHHKLYEMVYSLCHTFQRSYSSVSLVTPVLYAHLLAARARLYLDQLPPPDPGLPPTIPDLQPHQNLRDRLWFL